MPSKTIAWKYQENPVSFFFNPRIRNVQRLPNGNTLINEVWFGRFFEVDPEGEVVLEYVSPYFVGPPHAQVNQVFRVYRYGSAVAFGPPAELPRDRVIALHARALTFLHPVRYEPITLTAEVPRGWRGRFAYLFREAVP